MNESNAEAFLRRYVQVVVQEAMVKIGDQEFDIPEDKIDSLKAYIQKKLGVNPHDPAAEYAAVLAGLRRMKRSDLAAALDEKIRTGYPAKMQDAVKHMVSKVDVRILSKALFSRARSVDSVVEVPTALFNLAEFKTPGSAGSQIGRGELSIPLLFDDASLALKSNDQYDAKISGEDWHVKEGSASDGIRMGSAREKLFSSTPVYSALVKAGVSPSNVNELGTKKFAEMLPVWANLQPFEGATVESLYEFMSDQAVEAAVGSAAGIAWYLDGKYEFTQKSRLSLKGITQGRAILSVGARSTVLGLVQKDSVVSVEKMQKTRKR
jgi:hypothetical protein